MIDCFEFSKFCNIDQKIYFYPSFRVYWNSELKETLHSLSSVRELVEK